MSNEWIGLVIICFVVILVFVILLLVINYDSGGGNGLTTTGTTTGGVTLGAGTPGLYQLCNTVCAPGLVCVDVPTVGIQTTPVRRCLYQDGQVCLINQDCASGNCQKKTPQQNGICAPGMPPGPGPAPGPGGQTRVFCYYGNNWTQRYTIPAGLNFSRIAATGNLLLGVSTSTNQLYLWQGQWQSLTSNITAPGTLIDATITGNDQQYDVWAVYRLSGGQTNIYRLSNGLLSPFPVNTGGTQISDGGQAITIAQLGVSQGGNFYLTGQISGGQRTIFQRLASMSNYTPVSPGENIFVPNTTTTTTDTFAFSSGNSILLIGPQARRQDNVALPITSLLFTPDNTLWYLSNGQLYRSDGHYPHVVTAPVPIGQNTRLFYSPTGGVCIFTPGS